MAGRLPTGSDPATALRAALLSPWPALQLAAKAVVSAAITGSGTWLEVASRLGVSRRALSRLQADFPEVFRAPKKDRKST